MKRFLALAALIALFAAPAALACDKTAAMAAQKGHDCPAMMQGVERTVTNLSDGVRIELTANDPDVVRTLQTHMASNSKPHEGCEDCPMANTAWNRKVENTSTGVAMTLTASSRDDIEKIQTTAAAMTKGGCAHGAAAPQGGCPKHAGHKAANKA